MSNSRQIKGDSANRIIYVSHDQLNLKYGALAQVKKQTDLILFVESARMVKQKRWHFQKVHFLLSSARHFAKELEAAGFNVKYLIAKDTATGISEIKSKHKISRVICTEPTSYQLTKNLQQIGVEFVPNDFFLTSRSEFKDWAAGYKSFKMEDFYRWQRSRLGILVLGGKPEGGKWNFDADNRLPPPKNHNWPKYAQFKVDEIDKSVAKELANFGYWGDSEIGNWATTRAGALKRLAEFVATSLDDFGPYEDAMTKESWLLNHSVISPYLNNGLLHASEVVKAVVDAYKKNKRSLNSVEGFIRQVIGWREYVNAMYWYLGEGYRSENKLNAKNKLLPMFEDPRCTKMNCLNSIISDVKKRAWVHHIPRLMVLSNISNLVGVSPQAVLDWMRSVFVDATDWVMVPNVIGMGMHADGGQMMTKPYISGGAYISKMSDYCKSCNFDPKFRTGDTACPFTTLYWDYLDRNKSAFAKNHRMFQQLNGLKRLSDLDQVKIQAQQTIKALLDGKL
jgi:deoxyribodipyrimidine photolyase-related protein